MRIGELSKKTGVSIPTIRLYEREGLIGPAARTQGKLREFTLEQERRLDFIKRVRNLGFSLDDVKLLLNIAVAADEGEGRDVLRNIRHGIVTRKQDLDRLERCLGSKDGSTFFWNRAFQAKETD